MKHDVSVWICFGSFELGQKPMISCFVSLCLDFYIICLKFGTCLCDKSSCFCTYEIWPEQVFMIPCICFYIYHGLWYHAMKWICYAWLFHARHFILYVKYKYACLSLMSHAFGEEVFSKSVFKEKVLSRPQVLGWGNVLVELLCPLWSA